VKTIVTAKGQIAIPNAVRRKLGLRRGTRIQVDIDDQGHKIILTPITRAFIQRERGRYKGKGLLKALKAEKDSPIEAS
jgi:AbrB family looped-hinge helix DNA binding protein